MSNGLTSVELVARLFPGHAEELETLAANSEAFRSLCEDYELAANALRGLEQKNRPQDAERIVEYRRLISDLKRELQESLGGKAK